MTWKVGPIATLNLLTKQSNMQTSGFGPRRSFQHTAKRQIWPLHNKGQTWHCPPYCIIACQKCHLASEHQAGSELHGPHHTSANPSSSSADKGWGTFSMTASKWSRNSSWGSSGCHQPDLCKPEIVDFDWGPKPLKDVGCLVSLLPGRAWNALPQSLSLAFSPKPGQLYSESWPACSNPSCYHLEESSQACYLPSHHLQANPPAGLLEVQDKI